MKTLHVDCGREMQGGQWQVLYLTQRLADAVLLAPEESPLFAEAKKRGIDARPVSIAGVLQASRKADLVHAHDSRAHSLAAAASRKPLVVSRRVGFAMKRSVLSDLKYSAPAMFLAVSQYTAARMRERGIKDARIRVVPDGVPIPAQPSDRSAGVVAIAKTKREAIEAAGRALGVAIRFAENLWKDLETARVCVYWSEMEGLGSGALAAMAAGVPVIASRVGGLPEVVEDGRTGLLTGSPQEMEAALRRLLENADEAVEMGLRARETAIQKFSVEKMVQATVRIYEEVLG